MSRRIPCLPIRPGRAFTTAVALALAWWLTPVPALARGVTQGSFWILGALPQGEFKDNVNKNGLGLGGSFVHRFQNTPIALGGELDYAVYGQAGYQAFLAGLPVRVHVQTDNSILQGLLVLRVQTPAGPIRPYADGLFGFNYLFTTTTVNDPGNQQEIASDTNQHDAALAYGGGGGLLIPVWRAAPLTVRRGIRAVALDLRGRYLVGSEAKYLRPGTIQVVNDQLVFELRQSKTDLVTVGAGVTIDF